MSRHAVRILQQNRSLRCSMRPDRCSPDRVLSLPSPDPSKNSQCRLLHKWQFSRCIFSGKFLTYNLLVIIYISRGLCTRCKYHQATQSCHRNRLYLPLHDFICSYNPFHKNHPLPRVLGRLFLLLPNRRGKGYPFLQLFAKISHFVVSTKYTLSAMCRMSS